MSGQQEHEFEPRWKPAVEIFERAVVAVLALLLVLVITTVLLVAATLFLFGLSDAVASIKSYPELQEGALRSFGGILLVLLGLELLDTVKVYFRDHSIRVEVILMVGIIAMGRHVLELDIHHTDPLILYGFSALILVLSVSYFLVKRAQFPPPAPRADVQGDPPH